MSTDLALVLGLLAAAVVMFAINRPRMDVVAVIMLVALPLTGVISVSEAMMGLADPNVVLIAALFVIGEGLVRTGVAQRLGDWLVRRAGRSEARMIFLLMVIVAGVGSVMSSTGVVAIFIPIVLRIARNARIPAARLMMPLSMAALISGMMTLVATPPNLVLQGELVRAGHEGFGFFAFTPFGVPILALAIVYMLVARRFLAASEAAPEARRPSLADWIDAYALTKREFRLRIRSESALAGRRLEALDLRGSQGVNILAVERSSRLAPELLHPTGATELRSGDVLLLDVEVEGFDIAHFCREYGLDSLSLSGRYFTDRSQDIGMAELLVPPHSPLVGFTVVQARFRSTHDLAVIGLRRGNEAAARRVLDTPLQPGDTLLTVGPWRAIQRLMGERRQLIVMDLPVEFDEVLPAPRQAPFALGILALVVVVMVTGVVPNVIAALIGCLAMGLFRCIDMASAYRAIHWQSLVLIVGMLPFSLALQRTGGVDLASGALVDLAGDAGPRLLLAALFLATAVLSLFISNTATAVLMAPVALGIAATLGVSPYPFAMIVALAASAAFMTPVSSPVNTLVMTPGNYNFTDFLRIGMPFSALVLVVSVLLVPLILPF